MTLKKLAALSVFLFLSLFTGEASMTVEAAPAVVPVEYSITPLVANSHLIEIRTTYMPKAGTPVVEFAIPAWRPGRYLLQNYARNIQEFTATDGAGKALAWDKTDKNTWRVATKNAAKVEIRYKVYANILDAGSTLSNEDELYWNGTNVFMSVAGGKDLPAKLKVNVPDEWKIAIGLPKGTEPKTFTAPDYDTLADAPAICSPTLTIATFEAGGVPHHLVFQGPVEYSLEKLTENVKKIVAAQIAMFGGAPYPDYWFLFHSIPGGRYHGVEHLNSTSITFPASTFATPESVNRFYALCSHEFFHVWNVKRIRPKVLGPFDYSREVYTRNLWIAEGWTSYYDDLFCKRAGVIDIPTYLKAVGDNIKTMQTTPGRKIMSVAQASFDEWLTPDDARNVETDFYNKGGLLALMLDMEVRRRTNNLKSLDDVMRYLYDTYARKGVGYPEDGPQKALEAVAGGSFEGFFSKYVSGLEELPYNDYLRFAGVELVETKSPAAPEASLGVTVSGDDKQTTITNVVPGEAGFAGGLDKNDILLAINRDQVTPTNLSALLKKYKPGDTVMVHVFRRGKLKDMSVTLQGGGNLQFEVKPIKTTSDEQKAVFASWLNEPKS